MIPGKLTGAMDAPIIHQYRDRLLKKRGSLLCKRAFALIVSALMLICLSPLLLVLAIVIKCDSRGPVFFRQERITTGGKPFRIFKFRTMVQDADKLGSAVTAPGDSRVTRVGDKLRVYRLDELPQLINVFLGQMTFVGTRPEVPQYVDAYTDEMRATLLLPAGITSNASIKFKDEQTILNQAMEEGCGDIDQAYVTRVLPAKMRYNLEYLQNFGLGEDLKLMWKTVMGVFFHQD